MVGMGHGEKRVGKVGVGGHRVEVVLNSMDHESCGDQGGAGAGAGFLQYIHHMLQGVRHTLKDR